jgi:drug/metabolite transporter (DMT)-like permease
VIGELAALASALAFGTHAVFARRFMLAGGAPEAGVLLSIILNVLVYGALLLVVGVRGGLPPVVPLSIVWFILGGLMGSVVGRNLSFASIGRIGASRSTTVRLSNVAFALLFGVILLHELPRPMQIAGIAVVTSGLYVSLRRSGGLADSGGIDGTGVLLALGGGAAFALGDIGRRGGMVLTPSPLLGAVIGAVAALVAHLTWSVFRPSARLPAPPMLYNADMWGSAVATTLAVLLLWIGLRHAPVAVCTVLYNLQVLVVLLMSPLLLRGHETITGWLVAGTGLALVGTVLILFG